MENNKTTNKNNVNTNNTNNTNNKNIKQKNEKTQALPVVDKKKSKSSNKTSFNVLFAMIIILVITFIILLVFFSSSFRTKRTRGFLKTYQTYQSLKNFDFESKGELILGDHYIASSYNSCNVRKPYFAYIDCKTILYNILKSGARYLEVKIFNDKFGDKNTIPIINNGFETGEWKLCFNSKTFEEFCQVVSENAFSVNKKINNTTTKGVPNANDPLFISLDLKTRNNTYTLDNIAKLIMKYFETRLLGFKYASYRGNLLNIKMKDLKGKLVILSSGGHDGSNLTELINGCWEEGGNVKRYHIKEIDLMSQGEKESLKESTKKNLTILTPDAMLDNEIELNIFKKQNYDTKEAFKLGIHFVSVYYQSLDKYMDYYITKFKEHSIITKPYELQIKYVEPKNNLEDEQEFNYSEYRQKIKEMKTYLDKYNLN